MRTDPFSFLTSRNLLSVTKIEHSFDVVAYAIDSLKIKYKSRSQEAGIKSIYVKSDSGNYGLANGKTGLLNLLTTADWTFSWFIQSFPLFEPESAFFTFSRDYHQALFAFANCYPDMPEMINNIFFRNPDLCGYLAR